MRKILLAKITKDLKFYSIRELANRFKIPYLTLWRIINGKSEGHVANWEKIEKYYQKV